MEKGVRKGAIAGVAAYIQEPRCRRRALLAYFGEKRGACDPAANEIPCDYCQSPQVGRSENSVSMCCVRAAYRCQGGNSVWLSGICAPAGTCHLHSFKPPLHPAPYSQPVSRCARQRACNPF